MKVQIDPVIDLSPKVSDKEFEDLLPKRLFCKRMSFVISPVNNAIANGLRRTICEELLSKALIFDFNDFKTNNAFSINTMILNRFRQIPIDQSTPLDTVFELHEVNKTDREVYVYSGQMRIKHGALKRLPFNENIPLFTLEPGKEVSIDNIRIVTDYGYNYAGHALACNVVSLAEDQKPVDLFSDAPDRGIPSRLSNPQKWRIAFNTTGAMDPYEMVRAACDNIIERMGTVEKLLYSIVASGDLHVLVINGETDTVGNLLMRTILDLYPSVDFVAYDVTTGRRQVTIKIRTAEDVSMVFKAAIRQIVATYNDIKKSFSK